MGHGGSGSDGYGECRHIKARKLTMIFATALAVFGIESSCCVGPVASSSREKASNVRTKVGFLRGGTISRSFDGLNIHGNSTQARAKLTGDVSDNFAHKDLYQSIRSLGEECVQENELRALIESLSNRSKPIRCYDGFEPSGRMHIAQGVQKVIAVNRLTSCGFDFIFWVADWFAQLNNKLGGDLKKIQAVGRYYIEIFKALGMDISKVQFLWASEEINKRSHEYWSLVMDIARRTTLSRINRCQTVMGRNASGESPAAGVMYSCMQCADIFFLGVDICQMGVDQRKINMLAREYAQAIDKSGRRSHKPIILSHHMLPGLKANQEKMSKSIPDSAIYMEDSIHEVNTKIKRAYCPPKVTEGNPCLEYIRYLVLPMLGKFIVARRPADGPNTTYSSWGELEKEYISGKLHPGDVKTNLARALNEMLEPVRTHFTKDEYAKDLLAKIKKFKITR
mmetsp:Transcript_662/g.898  ORF Transcript_662/g.898 Transcript_662/m.898 type:complete len:452 (+) Transcript_662:53-1408(+)